MSVALVKTPAELAYDGLILPHSRLEDWKWTNLRTLVDRPYPPRVSVAAPDADVERLMRSSPFATLARARLVFVNGAFRRSAFDLARIGRRDRHPQRSPAEPADEEVIAMNAAFATDGVHISIKAGANIDAPIELVSLATAGPDRTIATRHTIELGARRLGDHHRDASGRGRLSHQQRGRITSGRECAARPRQARARSRARPSIWPMPWSRSAPRRRSRFHVDLGRARQPPERHL